jgi:hypothetical protein
VPTWAVDAAWGDGDKRPPECVPSAAVKRAQWRSAVEPPVPISGQQGMPRATPGVVLHQGLCGGVVYGALLGASGASWLVGIAAAAAALLAVAAAGSWLGHGGGGLVWHWSVYLATCSACWVTSTSAACSRNKYGSCLVMVYCDVVERR